MTECLPTTYRHFICAATSYYATDGSAGVESAGRRSNDENNHGRGGLTGADRNAERGDGTSGEADGEEGAGQGGPDVEGVPQLPRARRAVSRFFHDRLA